MWAVFTGRAASSNQAEEARGRTSVKLSKPPVRVTCLVIIKIISTCCLMLLALLYYMPCLPDGKRGATCTPSFSEDFEQRVGRRPRILVAKMGQDGHDRGARVRKAARDLPHPPRHTTTHWSALV